MHGGEHAAPAMAKDVVVILHAEMLEEVVEFVKEELRRPEISVAVLLGDMRAQSVAKLVVEYDGYAVQGGDVGKGEQVVVRCAGAACEG